MNREFRAAKANRQIKLPGEEKINLIVEIRKLDLVMWITVLIIEFR